MDHTLAQAHEGHRPAVAALVEALRPRITRMAAHYARRTGHDPDDLVQEAWVGLLEALPRLQLTVGSPDQHLIKRARWRLLDAVRRENVRRCLPIEAADGVAVEPHEWDNLTLVAFVCRLKPMQRDVLGCLLQGLTWREAGEVLGCTSANIAHHVRHIRIEYEAWAAQHAAL